MAKTRTIATLAQVLGGSFQRIQFTPDLVPSDLVGTRIWRPDQGGFETELGPVFCNFLLADEINRAPAKVQSALLEVMQEHQVTIGKQSWPVPAPFLVLATQNPIESDGTYPLPEAQVDRFLMKVVVEYPNFSEEMTIVARSLTTPPTITKILSLDQLQALQAHTANVYVDRLVAEYAVALCDATRHPATYNLPDLAGLHRLWGQPPRLDQPGRRRPSPGRAPGPQLRPAPRRPRTRPRRPAPPAGADLPGPGRTSHPRHPPHRRPQRHPPTPHRPRPRTTSMSFRWPELLWAVLLVPLVLLVWVRGERRRTQRAGVFGNPALLPNMVTARPGWRRVLPVLLYLLAATVLLLALARPEATAQVPRDQATIMLVMDYSESMLNTDVSPTRIEAAQQAADAFLEEIPERFQVGLVTFAGAPSVEALPTTDKDVIRSALRNAPLRRGTAVGDALVRALQASRPPNLVNNERPADRRPPPHRR